jgi:hypothetical protein
VHFTLHSLVLDNTMSDSEEEKSGKGVVVLKGADNFVGWKRNLQMKLASKELDEYLDKVPASILSETLGRIVTSEEPTPAEQTKINEAGYKCHRKAVTATTLIYNSLSSTVQNKVPNDKVDTKDPNPKALYKWLQQEFGATSVSRQSELWSMVWGMKVDEGEDPNPVLASVRSSLGELGSSLPAEMTAAQLVENMSAFAMLQTLPESYSLLASTLFASPSLSSDHVLATINQEWRRRQQGLETTAAGGYLAKKKATKPAPPTTERRTQTTRTGKDGKPQLGPNADAYCDEHKCYGHTISNCFRRNNAKQAATAQTGTDTTKSAQLAQITPDSGSEEANDEVPDVVADYLARLEPAAFVSTVGKYTVVVDSGATDTFIKDECLLSNVVTLAKPISVTIGDNWSVKATKRETSS